MRYSAGVETTERELGNHRLTVSYDGRRYFGWQRNGTQPTIQLALEQAITQAFGVRVPVQGSGRTDRGAHARGQVASARLPVEAAPADAAARLNQALPDDIRVLDVRPVADDFHARMSARGKQYRYVIWTAKTCPREQVGRVWHVPEPLDEGAMREACAALVGEHDFASFATRPNFRQKSTVRRISHATLRREGAALELELRADGFLYKMVRNIVRAVVKVGRGRYTPREFEGILKARDRRAAPGTAPACGLYLDEVFYGD